MRVESIARATQYIASEQERSSGKMACAMYVECREERGTSADGGIGRGAW